MEMNPQHDTRQGCRGGFFSRRSLPRRFFGLAPWLSFREPWRTVGLDGVVALLLIPAALAVLGAPGYGYAFFNYKRWGTASSRCKSVDPSKPRRRRFSSGGRHHRSIPTGFGPILSLWSLVMAVKLIIRFRKES